MLASMFQRQLTGPSGGLSRQTSSELASPAVKSRGVSRNNSWRAGCPPSTIPHSRSRPSLLVACIGPSGSHGDSDGEHLGPSSLSSPHGGPEPARVSSHHQPSPRASGPGPASAPSPPSPSLSSRPLGPSWDFSSEPYVPAPSNLPTNDAEELLYPPRPAASSLRPPLRRDLWTLTDQPGLDLFMAGPMAWSRLRQVYVILFGVGERDTEGIYSLRAFAPDGIPHETIIAFECEEEAQRYAGLLEASMDHTPHVCSIPPRELLSFCLDQTYSCRLEPRGSLLIPPDINVSITDWERSLRLRDGNYAVLEAEPDLLLRGSGDAAGNGGGTAAATTVITAAPPAPVAAQQQQQPLPRPSGGGGGVGVGGSGSSRPSTLARYSGLSGSDLEEIRARLETLLPADD